MIDALLDQQRRAARHMLQHPLTCAEQQPEVFALIRRHEQHLDLFRANFIGPNPQLLDK